MTKRDRLRDTAELAEMRAAVIARSLAEILMRPVAERAPARALAAELEALREDVRRLTDQLQRASGEAGGIFLRNPSRALTEPEYVRLLRLRLRHWRRVGLAVEACLSGTDWPLMPPVTTRFDLSWSQAAVMAQVFRATHYAVMAPTQTDAALDEGCFPDLPLDPLLFVQNVHLAYRLLLARRAAPPFRFLDVGCGAGLKVALAAEIFHLADGLEYDETYVAYGERTLAAMGARRSRVFPGDGRSFAGYADYDVIYLFRPMMDEDEMFRMERHIADTARPGSLVIGPYEGFQRRAEGHGFLHLASRTYLVRGTQDDADALLAEARHIGPHLVAPEVPVPVEAGWLRPLWKACIANGISSVAMDD